MSSAYTLDLGFANPAAGDCNWDDDWYRNQNIADIMLNALKSQNRVLTGGLISDGGLKVVNVEAGTALIDGVEYSWSATTKDAISGPLELPFNTNYVFVDSLGLVFISTTVPNGNYVILGFADCTQVALERVVDLRCMVSVGSETITEHINETGTAVHGLGTASIKDVTETNTDNTAGRLLKNYDFGIGSTKLLDGQLILSGNNLDDFSKTGVYGWHNTNPINSPTGVTYAILLVHASPSSFQPSQTVINRVTRDMYIRASEGGVWSTWRKTLFEDRVTTSTSDATIGKLLKVGDFGLGGTAVLATVDWNNYKTNGTYYANSLTNAPVSGIWFTVHVLAGSANYQTQIAMEWFTNNQYTRHCSSGTWGTWTRIAKTSNYLFQTTANALDNITENLDCLVQFAYKDIVNGPPDAVSAGFVETKVYSTGFASQWYYEVQQSGTVWKRIQNNSVWSTWNKQIEDGMYGIGIGQFSITADLNTLVVPGNYLIGSGSTNKPGTSAGLLSLVSGSATTNNNRLVQTFYDYLTGNTEQWNRSSSNGTSWSGWKKVLYVGDFGLGSSVPISYSTASALDNIAITEFGAVASVNVATVNGPTGATSGVVFTQSYSASYTLQTYSEVLYDKRQWTRRKENGVWTGWVLNYDQTHILGTVSQTAGVPTGAIIECGSNANGNYMRLADGTIICTRTIAIPTWTAGGKSSATWVFPSVFIIAPVCIGNLLTENPQIYNANCGVSSTTSVPVYAGGSIAANGSVDCIAIGRWF